MNAARRGEGEVGAVPDSDLFFIDTAEQADGDTEVVRRKSRDASTAPTTTAPPAAAAGGGRRARLRLALKKKPLRSELALSRPAHAMPIVPSSINYHKASVDGEEQSRQKKKKKKKKDPLASRLARKVTAVETQSAAGRSNHLSLNTAPGGVWDEKLASPHALPASMLVNGVDVSTLSGHLQGFVSEHHNRRVQNRGPSGAKDRSADSAPDARRKKKAVIVDGPGSSFNPDMRQHQDTIALEVAREEEKAYKDSLLRLELPSAQMLNSGGGGGADGTRYNLDEMLMELQHSGDEDNERHDSANDVYDEFDLDDTLDADARRAAAKARRGERVTRSERARRERHALLLRAQEEQRRVKQQRRDLGELRKLQSEIVAEDEERRMRLERKKAAANERAEELPPKLSRFRYDPEASSVLLTEEITGSLRKLPGGSDASALIRHRYKDLQRRGYVHRQTEPHTHTDLHVWNAHTYGFLLIESLIDSLHRPRTDTCILLFIVCDSRASSSSSPG